MAPRRFTPPHCGNTAVVEVETGMEPESEFKYTGKSELNQELWDIEEFQFSSVAQSVWLFATPWIAARQASLSITNSRSLLKLMSIEVVMPSSHLILCRPLLLLPSIPPSIRVFSNKPTLHMKWPKYWSFSFSISPSNEYSGLISFRIDWFDLFAVQGSLMNWNRVELCTYESNHEEKF